MNRLVIWSDRALADLDLVARQDRRTAQRISDTVDHLAEQNIGDVRKLAGTAGEYRLRVGNWRLLFHLRGWWKDAPGSTGPQPPGCLPGIATCGHGAMRIRRQSPFHRLRAGHRGLIRRPDAGGARGRMDGPTATADSLRLDGPEDCFGGNSPGDAGAHQGQRNPL